MFHKKLSIKRVRNRFKRESVVAILVVIPFLLPKFFNLIFPRLYPFNIPDWIPFSSLFDQEEVNYTFTPFTPNEKCKFCNYTVRNKEYANSTPRDVLMSGSFGTVQNIVVFLKTLRTTGSKCSVVVIMDNDAVSVLTDEMKEYIRNCGCQIINIGKLPIGNYPYASMSYFYYPMYFFLKKNKDKFDRVMKLDLFDAVFQGDPFNVQVNTTHLNIVDEGATFNAWTGVWVINQFSKRYPPLTEEEKKHIYVCGGYVAGGIDMIMHFIEELMKETIYEAGVDDQTTYNYLLLRGSLVNYPRSEIRKTDFVYHTAYERMTNEPRDFGNIRTVRDKQAFASIIHQYYYRRQFGLSVLKACPRDSPQLINYLAHCHQSCITKLEQCAKNPDCKYDDQWLEDF